MAKLIAVYCEHDADIPCPANCPGLREEINTLVVGWRIGPKLEDFVCTGCADESASEPMFAPAEKAPIKITLRCKGCGLPVHCANPNPVLA